MFCFQLRTATTNLINPPTVDSTYERNITEEDIPLITICPTNQTNVARLKELKYFKVEYLLEGATSCNETNYCKSWGAHANLTFDELLTQAFNNEKVSAVTYGYSYDDIENVDIEEKLVFIPKYGICKEISKFNMSQKLQVNYHNPSEARVLITNRNYRSYFMPDITSHVGSKIFIKPKKENYVSIKIQVKSYCNTKEEPMTEDEFKACVDEKIQKDLKQHIVCVPPWLSETNQCKKTYSKTFFGEFKAKFYQTYTEPISYLLNNIKFEDECRQSCKETTYIVNEGEAADLPYNYLNYGSTYLAFNQKVVVTEKVDNYSLFQYIIDVGSSLGLWLGLSVLGLHNLIVMAVQFIENSFIIKRIKSVTT